MPAAPQMRMQAVKAVITAADDYDDAGSHPSPASVR